MTHARIARATAGLGAAALLGVGLVGVAATPAYAVTATDTATLNDAIAANEPLIEIDGDFTLDDSLLPIGYEVEIIGHGATIDADGWDAFQFFASATVSDLTVVDTGTAFYAEVGPGETIAFTDVSATDVSFGIRVDSIDDGGVVTITGGDFTEIADTAIYLDDDFGTATATISGVAIGNLYKGIDVDDLYGTSTVTITDVTITDAYYGIDYYAYGDSIGTVTRTRITAGPSNNSGGSGDALYAYLADAASLRFDAGSIIGDPDGGDFFGYGFYLAYTDEASATITDSTISGNQTNVSADTSTDAETSFTMTGSVVTAAGDFNISLSDLAGSALIDRTTVSGGGTDSPHPGVYAYVHGGGELTISRSTVSGNSSGGVAIDFAAEDATATIINSTISGNDGDDGEAAAIEAYGYDAGTTLALLHSTVTANTDMWSGLWADNIGTVTVSHSILSGNDVSSEEVHLVQNVEATVDHSLLGGSAITGSSTLTEGDGVVETANPGLEPLADNGGPTLTHAPTAGSPALDAGDAGITGAPETDQRGEARIQGTAIDIGAVEIPAVLPATGAESGAGIVAAVLLLLLGAGLVAARRIRTV